MTTVLDASNDYAVFQEINLTRRAYNAAMAPLVAKLSPRARSLFLAMANGESNPPEFFETPSLAVDITILRNSNGEDEMVPPSRRPAKLIASKKTAEPFPLLRQRPMPARAASTSPDAITLQKIIREQSRLKKRGILRTELEALLPNWAPNRARQLLVKHNGELWTRSQMELKDRGGVKGKRPFIYSAI